MRKPTQTGLPKHPHDRLMQARIRAGFATATAAAEAMGIKVPTYLGHENGTTPFLQRLPLYATTFQCSMDWLMTGKAPAPAEIAGVRALIAATPEAQGLQRYSDAELVRFALLGLHLVNLQRDLSKCQEATDGAKIDDEKPKK